MNAAPAWRCFGADLTTADLQALAERAISSEVAHGAVIRRVSAAEVTELTGLKRDSGGLAIFYTNPWGVGEGYCRVRLDKPPYERQAGNVLKPTGKYVGPVGRASRLFFPPGVKAEQAEDTKLPLILTEGEFKTLALWTLALRDSAPRFLPVGIGGVWNWRGVIGKVTGPNGERTDEKGPIPDLDRLTWDGRKVIIAFDADAQENNSVRAARYELSKELRGRGAIVGFLEWPVERGKGIDDHLVQVGPDRVMEAISAVDFDRVSGWRAHCLATKNGVLKANLHNAAIALERAPEWRGVLGFDEFRLRTVRLRPAPWGGLGAGTAWTDVDDARCARWLQERGIDVGREIAAQAVQMVADEKRFHEVREYLNGLQWDGVPRLDEWLPLYCGVDVSQPEQARYARCVGSRWAISAVARMMAPGAKVDHVLILEGKQGAGKSTALKILGGQWFTDQLPDDLNGKDAALQLAGAWIVELSELDALRRSEASSIKAFITRTVDRYRPPYGQRVCETPRQCVFAGTVNLDTYLKDETGNRRFWPVKVGEIATQHLQADRDQLWAEAVARYKAGEAWWLDDAEVIQEATEQQAARRDGDSWEEVIADWIALREDASVSEVLTECLNIPVGHQNRAMQMRVAQCLKALGWDRFKSGLQGSRVWRYRLMSQPPR